MLGRMYLAIHHRIDMYRTALGPILHLCGVNYNFYRKQHESHLLNPTTTRLSPVVGAYVVSVP